MSNLYILYFFIFMQYLIENCKFTSLEFERAEPGFPLIKFISSFLISKPTYTWISI